MNRNVDTYFTDGCGRCKFGGTPQCKVNSWSDELRLLRQIVCECGLNEESKWGVPCYTFQKENILIISAFKEYCALSFFKGSLLQDTHKILDKPGEHTQSARLIRFTKKEEIISLMPVIKSYIFEAIEVEKLGLKIKIEKQELPYPEELQKKLEEIPVFKTAFEALTPGRRKGYIYYFSQPKQAKTREAKIIKYLSQIIDGKGLND